MNALDRLEAGVALGLPVPGAGPGRRHGDRGRDVALSRRGLSRFLKLGECVSLDVGGRAQIGEVVRIEGGDVTLKPFDARCDAGIGTTAFRAENLSLSPHPSWKGRVIDALGRPIDTSEPLEQGDRGDAARRRAAAGDAARAGHASRSRAAFGWSISSLRCAPGRESACSPDRASANRPCWRCWPRSSDFDTVVIALVGERGREVREFLDDTLGNNRASAITVVSTGDESPMMRRLAPKTAMTIAECFRDRGDSVLLIVDLVTRFAHAARDVALAAGEPAVARGYAPSVFSELPRLLERAGPGSKAAGSITGVFSVLVDGDDHNDPVADSIRGTLDGHIVLDRTIADQGRYPAVNILSSISRLADHGWTPEQRTLVARLRSLVARFEETRDLRLMGGYQAGSDPVLDQAVSVVPRHLRGDDPAPVVRPKRRRVPGAGGGAEIRQQDGEARKSGVIAAAGLPRHNGCSQYDA